MENFESLYRSYYEDVFRFLRGLSGDEHLAEELTQETFFRALRSLDTFEGKSDIRVWLCAIAKNRYYTWCQKQNRFSETEDPDALPSEGTHFTELLADKEQALKIHGFLHDLQEPYKEIFMLRIFGELSFREIGRIFGKTEHWACVTFHRAKAMLQKKVKEELL
ncbi:MAG: sigma-70 family RNA polymerase sigma factor [Ruminococcus sp.]|nr:sigma-70 family RNA polymerase sigma factor [Ruminococcus sp.]